MVSPQKTSTKRKVRTGSIQRERPIVYRGIKIYPIAGKRSPVAKAIREGFRTMSDKPRDPSSED